MQDVQASRAAIAQGKADVGGCPVGGASVAGKIGEIMGRRRLGKRNEKLHL
mgnify:CR=1 FL=1